MPLVDLNGAVDLHVHSSPCLFPRSMDDFALAEHARQHGLSGMLIKGHFESTVGRAFLVNQMTEGVTVLGGLTLNYHAGGLNPEAVQCGINLGARQIWMPTVDARAHAQAFGRVGGFGSQESGLESSRPGITVFDDDANLKTEAKQIMEQARDGDVILGTGHLGQDEVMALCRLARDLGFNKLLVTHPYFTCPRLSLDQQKEAVRLGAMLELCGGNLFPLPGVGRLEDFLATVGEIGPESVVLSSDAGQPRISSPHEVLRVVTQCLMDRGVSQKGIDLMCKLNPVKLLNM